MHLYTTGYVITCYFRFVFRPRWLQDLSYMGTFGAERWVISHAGNEFVLKAGLPMKGSSWNEREWTEI